MSYPSTPRERDRWILSRRPPRVAASPAASPPPLLEVERDASGRPATVATVFLVNRECPWRCLMCDLWKYAVPARVGPGVIPTQLDEALARLRESGGRTATALKLYNAGSFFDPLAIPLEDHPAIADRVRGFGRVVVECHPALVGDRVLAFRDQLGPGVRLEVAMGLETVHPDILPRLNKRMTLEQFAEAAAFLRRAGIDLRAFILVKPPFLPGQEEAVEWAVRSVAFAAECGAAVAVLIPTRGGNGAVEELAREGLFQPPTLRTLETAFERSLDWARGRLRVFADAWDLERFSRCPACAGPRRERLERMNLSQEQEPGPFLGGCRQCGE